ncbi:MAG: hypothetical protein BWZ01_02899 [Deltaproteobacteria bacterium ADurb.BinA179]|nr:MAG: hypothetical protein BWZ01_02899 [Deltaproteobacteria bacterium ADurb.BinA179]
MENSLFVRALSIEARKRGDERAVDAPGPDGGVLLFLDENGQKDRIAGVGAQDDVCAGDRGLDGVAEVAGSETRELPHDLLLARAHHLNGDPQDPADLCEQRDELLVQGQGRYPDDGRPLLRAGGMVLQDHVPESHRVIAPARLCGRVGVASAEVAPADFLRTGFHHSDPAGVFALPARHLANLDLGNGKAFKAGFPFHFFTGEQRGAVGPHHMAEGGDHHLRPRELLQCGDQTFVPGSRTLEHDPVGPVGSVSHHAVQIILENGVKNARHDPLFGISVRELPGDLLVHEYRAPVGVRQRLHAHDRIADLVEAHAQRVCLLFYERARAGRTDIVHVCVYDPALMEADELGVLAADLEDGLHAFVHGLRALGVGRDLVDDEVGRDDGAHELSSRSCRATADDLHLKAERLAQRGDAPEDPPGGVNGVARGLGIDVQPDGTG